MKIQFKVKAIKKKSGIKINTNRDSNSLAQKGTDFRTEFQNYNKLRNKVVHRISLMVVDNMSFERNF